MTFLCFYSTKISLQCRPHQWDRGSVVKTGRLEVPGSIPDRTCQFIHLEFSVAFLGNYRKCRLWSLRPPLPHEMHFLRSERSFVQTIGFDPTIRPNFCHLPPFMKNIFSLKMQWIFKIISAVLTCLVFPKEVYYFRQKQFFQFSY